MREEAVADFLKRAGAEWNAVRRLVGRGELIETDYEGRKFYLRKFKDNARSHTSGREVASGG
jgi:butyrate kinase